jgi:hypothetical protein
MLFVMNILQDLYIAANTASHLLMFWRLFVRLMGLSKIIALTFAALFCFIGSANQCQDNAFSVQLNSAKPLRHVLTDKSNEELARLSRLVNVAVEQLKKNPGPWIHLFTQMTNQDVTNRNLIIESDQFEIDATFKSLPNGELVLHFVSFKTRSVERDSLNFTEENPTLNFGFIKLVATVLMAVNHFIEIDPAIKSLRIEAELVINPALVKLLEGFGFSRAPELNSMRGVIDYIFMRKLYRNWFIQIPVSPNPNLL